MAIDTDLERYSDPQGFAREVNLPLLGVARIPAIPAGATVSQLLGASAIDSLSPIVDGLVETRRSLTLHTLLLAGFPNDPECFAVGLALGREWSRRGLRVAVVDLDFWNPTIVLPADQPNEGFVDVLEYGCSFGRVAWEIVADRLWVVGPGSHPPDEDRIAEHPDWPRASRVFSGRADVTLFVAPLLDRHGFTGKLSKRMDAALLVASVERTSRADLRDAFLELWGSDAPMIGCVGVEAAAAPRSTAGSAAPAEAVAAPVAAPGAFPSSEAEPAIAPEGAPLASWPRAEDDDAVRGEEPADESDGMVETLDREVRRGVVRRKARGGFGRAALWIGVAAVIALAAAIFDLVRTSDLSPGSGAVQSPQPAGEEPIGAPPETPIRSDLGGGTPATLPDVGVGAKSPAAPVAPAPTNAAPPATKQPPVATKQPPTATKQPPAATKQPPPVTPAAASDVSLPFRVHVASFRSEEKVQGIVHDLKAKRLDAWYEAAPDMPGWYRVFVGRFRTSEEAGRYAAWLLEQHLVDRAQSFPSTAR